MPDKRPNILLIMTDQQRGDCLGIEGHPVLQTPTLDWLAASGVRFSHGYTACPICVAARRTLMTGLRPATHGVVSNYGTLLHGPTLPGELTRAGYQTHLSGKLHLWPLWKNYGFEAMDLSDGPGFHEQLEENSAYLRFLQQEGVKGIRPQVAHGCSGNSWVAAPWHLEDRFHVANWTTERAMDFLQTRDRTRPFFLKLSYFHPHTPVTPPRMYYDRYLAMDLPEPFVGDWARIYDGPQRGLHVASSRVALDPPVMKQFRAAYYGSINHLSDQVQRVLDIVPLDNTVIMFTSDHGEMLGDHQWMHKSVPYEPSARVPFFMWFPPGMSVRSGQVRDEPVELMDVMPTLLDVAGAPIPETVDGASVMPLVRGEKASWREYVHGEYHDLPPLASGMQYLTNGKRKYVWYPARGEEQFFDLEQDPNEMHELSRDPAYKDRGGPLAVHSRSRAEGPSRRLLRRQGAQTSARTNRRVSARL